MRRSSPSFVQALWDGIERLKFSRSEGGRCFVSLKTLKVYLNRKLNLSEEEILTELQRAKEDKLVVSLPGQSTWSRNGIQSDLFGLTDREEFTVKGKHAWYCFKCSFGLGSGDAVWCTACPRTYHTDCLQKDEEILGFTCKVCKTLNSRPSADERLNVLIKYSCSRFYKWGITILNRADGRSWAKASGRDEAKNAWRYDRLIYSSIDLSLILNNAIEFKYKSLEEYWADCSTLVHNVAVYFGSNAGNYTKGFHKDLIEDLKEMRLCPDCFRHSNELPPDWFALPCENPHEVVWAKLGRYPYWPAKVMDKNVFTWAYDVQFFGESHTRASKISWENIQPIHTSSSELGIRTKTKAWERAYEELQKFQQLASSASEERPIVSINRHGSTLTDVSVVSNPERTEGCIPRVLDEKNADATVANRKRSIIKGNNREAFPTGSKEPKRKKSVTFATDCIASTEEVKNPKHAGDLTAPEATDEVEATTVNRSAEDCPQQQSGCLAGQSNQTDGAGQGLGSTLADVSFTMNLEELPEEYKIDVLDEDVSDATVTDGIQDEDTADTIPIQFPSPADAEELTNDKNGVNVLPTAATSGKCPVALNSAADKTEDKAGLWTQDSKQGNAAGQFGFMGSSDEDVRTPQLLAELQCCLSIDEKHLSIFRKISEKMKGCKCDGCQGWTLRVSSWKLAYSQAARVASVFRELQYCESVNGTDMGIIGMILGKMKGCKCPGCQDRNLRISSCKLPTK